VELIWARQPQVVSQWISRVAGEILKEEGAKLAQLLRPPQGQGVSTTLENFSLERILADAEYLAPTLCILLRSLAREEADKDFRKEKRRNVDLVRYKSVENCQTLIKYLGPFHRYMYAGADAK
jgi:hypothetical protein